MFYKRLQFLSIAMLVLALPAAFFVSQLSVDNRQEKLINQTGAEASVYRQFKEDFGHDEFIIVALSNRDHFDEQVLDDALTIAEELAAIEQVVAVNGVPIIYSELFGEEDADALREEMTSTPFYRNLLISADESVSGLMLQLAELSSVDERRQLVEAVEQVAQSAREKGFRVDLVGQPMFSVAINRITSQETLRVFPVAGIAALLVLLALLRSLLAALAILLCGGLALLYTMAVIALAGWEMNLITTSLPLVLFVLAIANGIHIASRYRRSLNDNPDRIVAMESTLRELRKSCGLSCITTAIGFLSLMVADLDAISQMGIYMSLGILFSLLCNFTVGAWLLIVFRVGPADANSQKLNLLLQSGCAIAMHRPRTTLAIFGLLVLIGCISVSKVSSSGDSLQFLPSAHPLTESHRFVSEHLTGLTAIEIVVETPGGWLNDDYWPPLVQLTESIEKIENVKRVHSPLSVLMKINQWSNGGSAEAFQMPSSSTEAKGMLTALDDASRQQLTAYATAEGDRIRVSVLADLRGDAAVSQLLQRIRYCTDRLLPPLSATSTGIAVQMRALSEGLLETQMKSYSLAFLLIFTAIGLGFRSRKLLLMSIAPNVMPMLMIFTMMWLMDIALNTATVMVASISLGIAVDNTVHFLGRFDKQVAAGESPNVACRSTIGQVGPAITITTVTACIGFFALMPSSFDPIVHLGLLSGSAILVALIANLLLLPALITLCYEEVKDVVQ